MSILDLSKRIGKSKSTIYEHLKKMLSAGFVKVSREEKSRSNIKRKYYSWVEKDSEYKKPEKYTEEFCRYKIEQIRSFAVMNQSILRHWVNFLDNLKKRIDQGDLEHVIITLKKLYEDPDIVKPYSSVAFYTPENAELFGEKIKMLYREIPDEVESKCIENPYYGGMNMLPIRFILDSLFPIEEKDWRI